MTQDEIIEMAKLVVGNYEQHQYWPFFTEELEAFAKLVAAKEREACAERAWIALVMHKQPWEVRQDVTEAIRARGEA